MWSPTTQGTVRPSSSDASTIGCAVAEGSRLRSGGDLYVQIFRNFACPK